MRRHAVESAYGSSSFGLGSFGGDDTFGSPSFTPRRAAGGDDPHLRSDSLTLGSNNGTGGGGGGIGTRSSSSNAAMAFGTASGGVGAGRREEKSYAPRSLMDAQRGGSRAGQDAQGIQREGSTAQQAAAALNSFMSPAQAASTRSLRSSSNLGGGGQMFAGGPSAGIPSQSLRDSPFMQKQAPAAAAPAASSAAAAAAASSSHLLSTPAASPFTTDASPIRFTPKPAAASAAGGGALNNNPTAAAAAGKLSDEEHKEGGGPPSSAGLFATPYASATAGGPAWLQTPGPAPSSSCIDGGLGAFSISAQQSTQSFTPGLGYAPRSNPCAVTVFGFAPAQAARVLARFHSFGEIVAREDGSEDEEWCGASSSTGGAGAGACNWMHLTYRTPVAASMALAQNGRVICEGALMIGVKPRAQPIDEAREGAVGIQPKSRSTPAASGRESIFERSAARRAGRGGAEPAAAASASGSIYATPQATHPSLVRKNPCTSLMEYLFNY